MAFQPMPLLRRPLPFDHPEWIFELKYDGFRSLAVIQNGRTQLISRNGNPFNSFADLCKRLPLPLAGKTVLDGEIVCLDKRGRPQFRDLLFHRGEPCFFAFDLLMSDGKDLRTEKLTDRKQELRRLMSKVPESRLRYADHVEQHGTALFQRVCQLDLEGIVAKHSLAPYTTERTTWFKIKNPKYSQMEGREELFESEPHREPVAGWHSCELACAEAGITISGSTFERSANDTRQDTDQR
jgi:bifunctional non-homologous end joining protein LigD